MRLEDIKLPETATEKELLELGAIKKGDIFFYEDGINGVTAGWRRGSDGTYYLSYKGVVSQPNLESSGSSTGKEIYPLRKPPEFKEDQREPTKKRPF